MLCGQRPQSCLAGVSQQDIGEKQIFEKHFSSKPNFTLVLLTEQVQQNNLLCIAPILPGLCHLPQTLYTRQYSVYLTEYYKFFFDPSISAYILHPHPHSHELQYPSSKLLCLSMVVDCRVDIESSLSRHSLIISTHRLAYPQLNTATRHQLIVVYPRSLITVCTVYIPPSIQQRTFQIDTIVAIVTVRIK